MRPPRLRAGRVDLTRRRLAIVEATSEVRGEIIFGTPKTHQRRSVPFPRFLTEPLAALVTGRAPDDLVFTSPDGHVLRNTNFRRRVFDPAARRAGVPGLTPHELRHTAASLAVAAGANIKAVQQMLGHASAAMTLDVYAGPVRRRPRCRRGAPRRRPSRGEVSQQCGLFAD